ncbi:hypothetical protein QE429_002602 [Bacillus sp. SORGH_AS 510]|nr:hypothetical protein [Bacillus sp. SORGH_AS_0510]
MVEIINISNKFSKKLATLSWNIRKITIIESVCYNDGDIKITARSNRYVERYFYEFISKPIS